MNFVGKFEANQPPGGLGLLSHADAPAHSQSQTVTASHVPADAIIVPDAHLLFTGDFTRSGVDLILSRDHHELVLHDYFKGEKHAALASPDGAHLTGDIVNALTGHVEYAQANGSASVARIIGHVTKLSGTATAVRNGVSIILNSGDNVEKGDVVQTGSGSTLGLTFIDGTVFGLSQNARMVLNEMVYDPNGSNNSSLLSLVAGTISFVAGETAKHGDMKIDTPVATMGIRGTAVLVQIDFQIPLVDPNLPPLAPPAPPPEPSATFQVLLEPDGTMGSYILFDKITLLPLVTVDKPGTYHVSHNSVTIGLAQLTPELQKLVNDVFTMKFTDSNTKTYDHDHFTDTLIPQSFAPFILANGASAIPIIINVVASGSSTATTTSGSNSVVHIDGPPHVDIINFAGQPTSDFPVTELAGKTADATDFDSVSGKVSFDDINIGDLPTVSTSFVSYTYQDAQHNDVTGALSTLQQFDIGLVEANLVVVQTPGNKNTGSATWTYSVADGAFDFLAAGESVTLTYKARVDNNYAPNDEAGFQTFTITITGTNDVPVITTGPQTIAFTGGITTPGGDLTSSQPTSGTLSFKDVDLTDTHTVSTVLTSAVLSGGTVPPGPLAIFETALTASIATDSTGTGSGTINWNLADLPVYLADFVPNGQTLTLTYTVTVADEHNAISTQTVTVTIAGNNTPAVVWIATTTPGSTPGGLWSDSKNWETGTVPTANDDAIIITNQLIGLTPSYPVTIDQAAVAKTVTMNDFGTSPPQLINDSTLTIGNTFDVSADSIVDNFGTITVGGLMEVVGTSGVENSGTIKLNAGGDFKGQSTITNNAGGTIEVAGGTLNVLVDIANSDLVLVDANAKLTLNSATISDGTVTNNGEIDLNGTAVLKKGSLGNAGQIKVSGIGNALDGETVTANNSLEVLAGGALLLDDGTTVSNGGTITVDGTGTLTLNVATIAGGTLNNSGTVVSTGDSTLSNVSITNTGTIESTGGVLTIDPTVVATLTNPGTLEANGGELDITSEPLIDTGALQAINNGKLKLTTTTVTNTGSGTVTVGAGSTLDLASANISGGTLANSGWLDNLSGSDIISAAVTNTGTVEVIGGMLDLSGGLSGVGSLIIDAGTTLELAGADAQAITFAGGTDTLQLDDVLGFTGTITGVSSTGGTFTITGPGNITTTSGDGIDFTAGVAGNPAIVTLTPSGTITGAANGIDLVQNGVGDLSIEASGSVVGLAGDGVIVEDSTTGLGNIVVDNTGSVTGTGTGSVGLLVENLNAANDGNITITQLGGVSGGLDGMFVQTDGNGNVAVESAGTVTGGVQYGIFVRGYGSGDLSLVTDAGSVINSGGSGLDVTNLDSTIAASADSTVTVTAYGTINSGTTNNLSGFVPSGITAGYFGANAVANTNINGTVVVNNNANITAAAGYGIEAFNYGNGNVTVNDEAATTVSGAQYGIAAYGLSGGTGDVAVNVAENATITGTSIFGIQAVNFDVGNISVSISSGDVINSGSTGINVNDQGTSLTPVATKTLTVTANGTINSGSNLNPSGGSPAGINAGYSFPAGQGANAIVDNVIVESNATIVAAAGNGINTYNLGIGDVTVSTGATSSITAAFIGIEAGGTGGGNTYVTNDGTVSGGSSGINAVASFAGNISVTNNGQSTGIGGAGINIAQDSQGATGSTTITNTGTVLSTNYIAITVEENATGTATIDNTAGIIGSAASLSAQAISESGGDVILNNTGDIYGTLNLANGTFNNETGAIWQSTGGSFGFTSTTGVVETFTINNDGTIDLSGGASLSGANGLDLDNTGTIDNVSDSNTISGDVTNTGTIEVLAGTLDLAGGLSGVGSLIIDAGATLELAGADAQTVTFAGGSDTLQLDDVLGFTGTITGTSSTGGMFEITGAGNITTTTSGDAIDFTASGGTADDPADVTLTPGGTITGAANGIDLVQNGVGDLTIDASGSVVGLAGDGVIAEDSTTGVGNITIDSTGSATGTGTGSIGLLVENLNAANDGNINVTQLGGASGSTDGIRVLTDGNGDIAVESAGTVAATVQYGILVSSYGTGDISVTTDPGTVINSGSSGINAINHGTTIAASANSTITVTGYGTISSGTTNNTDGSVAEGIVAGYYGANAVADTNINGTVVINNYADVTAAAGYGVLGYNYGNGDVTVNDEAGTTVSGAQYGVAAYSLSGGTGNVAVNVGANATITGSSIYGIEANSNGVGNVTVSTSAGDVINSGSNGINVGDQGTSLTPVATGTETVIAHGTINSGANLTPNGNVPSGINAGYSIPAGQAANALDVNVIVESDATIVAAGGNGITAYNQGTGDVTVSTGVTSSISAPGYGIGGFASGGGDVTVTNDGTASGSTGISVNSDDAGTVSVTNNGQVTGTLYSGIFVSQDSAGATGSTTITNTATVLGNAAITVEENATGTVTIDNNSGAIGSVASLSNQAIYESGGDITINNTGDIYGTLYLANGTFNNEVGGTWQVAGSSGFGVTSSTGVVEAFALNNDGTIDLSGGASLSGANGLDLDNTGTIDNVSDSNTISGDVTNTGTIEVLAGTLDLAGGLSGVGSLIIDAGATLELAGADAQTVTFAGGSDTLQLDDVLGFTGTITGTSSTGGMFEITGAGNITTTTSGDAIDFTASGGTSGDPADVTLTPSGTITGAANGIDLVQNGVGDLTVDASGDVVGLTGDGVIVEDSATGVGNLVVDDTGSVTGTGTGSIGLLVENLNAAANGNINITQLGGASGATDGIRALTYGDGNIAVEAAGAITATDLYGIRAGSYGTGDISVTTDPGTVINSGGSGIIIGNLASAIAASADSTITVTAYGTINSGSAANPDGAVAKGIVAGYYGTPNVVEGGTGLANTNVNGTVVINNYANVTAAAGYGVEAYNFGNGNVTVNDEAGTSVSGAQYGVAAYGLSGGTGDIAINVGANATITGDSGNGIEAYSTDTGNVTVSTSAGDIIDGGTAGINANGQDGGNVCVTNDGTVTGTAGDGINASALGGGNVSVTNNGTVTGSVTGLYTSANLAGNVCITNNGQITAIDNTGINVTQDSPGATGSTKITNVGKVFGSANDPAIVVFGNATGTVTIDNSGTIDGSGFMAIYESGGDITINNTGKIDGTLGVANGTFNNETGAVWFAGYSAFGFTSSTGVVEAFTINNDGTIDMSGGSSISGADGVVINNTGTIDVETLADAVLDGVSVIGVDATTGAHPTPASLIEVGATSMATLLLDDGTSITNGNLTISSGSTLDVESGSGATLDGVTVTGTDAVTGVNATAASLIEVGATGTATLLLDDGTTITNGNLTIGGSSTLDVESGASGPGATLDGVSVTGTDAVIDAMPASTIEVGATSTATLLLDDGTTITNGNLTIGGGSTLDVESGASGPGATLDGVSVTGTDAVIDAMPASTIEVGVTSTATLLLDDGTTITNGTLTIGSGTMLNVEAVPAGGIAATLDGVTVNGIDATTLVAASTIEIGTTASSASANLVLDDGTTINGGALTIGGNGILEIEVGPGGTTSNPDATLDGVTISGTDAVIDATPASTIEVGASSTATLLLDDGTAITNGNLTIGGGSTLDVESGASGPGATLDGVSVTGTDAVIDATPASTIEVGASSTATLLLDDGTTITNGNLTIGGGSTLDVESGASGPGATLDGVSVTVTDAVIDAMPASTIEVGASSTATLLLDDGTTITNGNLSIAGGSTLDVESGTNGPGATLDGVSVTGIDAVIDTTPASTIEVGVTSTATLTLEGGTTINGGTLSIGSTGTVDITGDVTLDDLTIDNSGLVQVGPDALLHIGGTVKLEGGGTVELIALDGIVGSSTPGILDNVDDTITGETEISTPGYAQLTLINEIGGTIDANLAGKSLTVGNPDAPITNDGLMEATNGGTLTIEPGEVDNDGGTIAAFASSTVAVNGATVDNTDGGSNDGILKADGSGAIVYVQNGSTIIGGTLSTSDGGLIDVAYDTGPPYNHDTFDGSHTGDPLTIDGAVQIDAGASLTLLGTIDNNGTITVDGGVTITAGATLLISGDVTLDGSGSGGVVLDGTSDAITGNSAADILENVNNEISGFGKLGDGGLTLINDTGGTIAATDATNALIIDTGTGTFTNSGLVESDGAGGLEITGDVSNEGTLEARLGTLKVDGDISSGGNGANTALIDGGTLDLGGTDAQAVTFNGAGTLQLEATSNFTGTVSGFATGDVIDLANTTVTTAVFDGSTLVVNGQPISFQISGVPANDTFAFKSDGLGGSDLVVLPQVLTVGSPSPATGVEGTAIQLDFSESVTSGASLSKFVISGIPNGAILSDGTGPGSHSQTVTDGTLDVAGWNLSTLTITPTNAANFTLSAMVTAVDNNGYSYTVPASETVTVTPEAPTVSPVAETAGEGQPIALDLGIAVNALSGDSNSLASLLVSAIPSGVTLTDGTVTHTYTSLSADGSVDIASWNLSTLTIQSANAGSFTLNVAAVTQDAEHNPSITVNGTEAVTVNGLPVITPAAAQTIGVGETTAISGVSLSETGNTSGETFTVTLSDANGDLSATAFGDGDTVTLTNSGTTLTIIGSLSDVNHDLATLTDTDNTATALNTPETITLHATDGLNNIAVAQTIAVTVNGLPVITPAAAQTIGIGQTTAISGVSLSETGTTTGEIFTVTLSDAHGDLSATAAGDGDTVTLTNSGTTLTIVGSLSDVNHDLATLTDTDNTATALNTPETITLHATDGLNNIAVAQTIAVTVNGLPAAAPTVAIAHDMLSVNENGSVALGISETPANSGDPVLVTISGIPADATLTDNNNDTLTVSNGSITLTQPQLSGLSLKAGDTSGTLTVTAEENGPSTVNFDSINTSGGTVDGAALASYLAGYGVTLSVTGSGADVAVANQNQIYGGGIVEATSGSNVIIESGGSPDSYTLTFAKPLSSFAFDQVIENSGPSGSSYAAWSATAYDSSGNVVSTVGDPNVSYVWSGSDPAVHYTLSGSSDITSVTISGSDEGFAGFDNIVTDSWVLTPAATAGTSAAQTIAVTVVPPGTTSADSYVWGSAVAGSWDVASNWNDTTAGQSPANVAPGINDNVTINAAGAGAIHVITGTGDAASLAIDGATVLAGQFEVGTLALANSETLQLNTGDTLTVTGNASLSNFALITVGGTLTVDGTLALNNGYQGNNITIDGGTLTAGSLTTSDSIVSVTGDGTLSVTGNDTAYYVFSNYQISGGSTFTVGGTFYSNNDTIDVSGGSHVQLAGLVSTAGGPAHGLALDIQVDGTSSLEVGTAGSAAAGSITIDSGVTVTEFGTFSAASIVNDGTLIVEANNELSLNGSLGGNGQIQIGSGANLAISAVAAASTNTIDFTGTGDALTIGSSALNASHDFIPTISGFNASDVIDFQGTVTSASYDDASGVLTLLDGSTAVAHLTIGGGYAGDTFETTAISGGVTQIVDPPGTPVTIADGATLQVDAPTNEVVTFASGTGTLDLAQPSTFTGEIAGITGTGNVLDMHGFAAATTTATTGAGSFNNVTDTTTLTVTDASDHQTETFTLAGDLSTSHWNVTDDTHGGADIVDPPASTGQGVGPVVVHDPGPGIGSVVMHDPGPNPGPVLIYDPGPNPDAAVTRGPGSSPSNAIVASAANQTWTGTASNDTFVFNFANVGHDTVTDFHPATDTLQFSSSVFADVQAAFGAVHDDGHGNTVVTIDANDTITLAGILKAQLHVTDFHIA